MAKAKQVSKRKRRNTALPVLGAAGISLAMAGGASATPPAANVPSEDTGPRIALGEEEIADVSLATFYVFDRENENESELGEGLILAKNGGGCGGKGGGCGGKGGGCGGGCKCGGGGGGCKCGGGGGGGCKCGGGGGGCKCGGGCGGGCGCGGGGLWLGACIGCGGGCVGGGCWRWSSYYGRWIYVCY